MQGMSGNQVQEVEDGVLDELDLDHPLNADARDRILKRRGCQSLREHFSTVQRRSR